MGGIQIIASLVLGSLLCLPANARDGGREKDLPAETLRLIRNAQEPQAHPNYRGIFFELHRLQQLPNGLNPRLLGLEMIEAPKNSKNWPPNIAELETLLKDQVGPGADKETMSQDWLDRLHALLRVENTMQRLPANEGYRKLSELTAKLFLQPNEMQKTAAEIKKLRLELQAKREALLMRNAADDATLLLASGTEGGLKGNLGKSIFADTRIGFPPTKEIAVILQKLIPANSKIKPGLENGSLSLSLEETHQLLKSAKPGTLTPQETLDFSRHISQNVRAHLLPKIASNKKAADLLGDLLHKDVIENPPAKPPVAPPKNFFAENGPQCGGANNDSNTPYYRSVTPAGAKDAKGKTNACFSDPSNHPENLLAARPDASAKKMRSAPQDGFRIEMESTSGKARNVVGSCMASILDPAAAATAAGVEHGSDFPVPSAKPGFRRVVMLTASHCIEPDLEAISLLGFARIPRENLQILNMEQMTGEKSDFTMVAADIPEFQAADLLTQRSRFVAPPKPDLEVGKRSVVADVNILRPTSNQDRIAGSTFAIPNGQNEFGLNFQDPGNLGQGIYPGNSGGGVLAMVDGVKTWLGAVSYKCLGAPFQNAVGAMASGKSVFNFINQNLAHAIIEPTGDGALRSLSMHRGIPNHSPRNVHFQYEPVHAGI